MRRMFVTQLMLLIALLGPVRVVSADPGQTLAELEKNEPRLDKVRKAALRHAGLEQRPERSWGWRARASGLMPVLTLQADRGTSHDNDLSRSSTGTEKLDIGVDESVGMQARAVWQLGRLVFDDAEIRATQMAQRLQRERIQVLIQVTNLYFQRRKLIVETMLAPQSDRAKAALQAVAIAELTAQLDALTGGYFSEELGRLCGPRGDRKRAGSTVVWACL